MIKSIFGKSFIIASAMAFCSSAASAQENSNIFGIGNRVAVGVGVGTEGIGFDAAVPITKYLQARVGVNIVPKININTTATVSGSYQGVEFSDDMDVTGKLSRTTFDVTGGFSFGGGDLMSITGHSDKLAQEIATGKSYGIEIGDYKIPVDENGNVSGGIKVKDFRPYVGLGFGRLIPKKRFGVRFELGAQFQGAPTVYADGQGDLSKVIGQDTDDDISKFMDYLKVYPVLKLSLRGRIL